MNISTAGRSLPVSEEDYLAGEANAKLKHEYVDGLIYAMVGGEYAHSLIGANVIGELHAQLKGKPCRALTSDTKLRVSTQSRTRFYYPAAMVVCGQHLLAGVFQDQPTILVEVLSRSTRRTDEGEKKEAYLAIDSLAAYVLFEQDCVAAIAYRRQGETFERQTFSGLEASIELPSIDCRLGLAAVYANVDFSGQRK